MNLHNRADTLEGGIDNGNEIEMCACVFNLIDKNNKIQSKEK